MSPESRLGHILVSSTAGEWRGTTTGVKYYRHTLQLLPTQQAATTPEQLWWSWRGWTAGCRYSMRDASLRPRKHRPVRHLSEAATGLRSCHHPALRSRTRVMPSVTALALPGARPDQEVDAHAAAIEDPDVAWLRVIAGRGSRRFSSERDGRRCSRPSFGGCPFDGWPGSWESTERR